MELRNGSIVRPRVEMLFVVIRNRLRNAVLRVLLLTRGEILLIAGLSTPMQIILMFVRFRLILILIFVFVKMHESSPIGSLE